MSIRHKLAAIAAAAAMAALPGCSVMRDETTGGGYSDDSGITTAIKSKYAADKTVGVGAIKVETINGTVMLSGSAKNAGEKANAEALARSVKGVISVDNRIAVRP